MLLMDYCVGGREWEVLCIFGPLEINKRLNSKILQFLIILLDVRKAPVYVKKYYIFLIIKCQYFEKLQKQRLTTNKKCEKTNCRRH